MSLSPLVGMTVCKGLFVFFQNQIEKDELENIRGELLRSSGLSESEVSYTNLVQVNHLHAGKFFDEFLSTGLPRAVGNVSGCRYVSDCRSWRLT